MMNFEWNTAMSATTVRTCSLKTEQSVWLNEFSDGWEHPFLIIDSEVRRLWDNLLQPAIMSASGLYIMEAREVLKNTFTLSRIWDSMSAAGIHRDTPVVVIGGGLVCDIGAMAASTYLRGLRLMLVPTTLLCMVDACLGGKTGVNLASAKNQVGTFNPAEKILIAPDFLDTLPNREFKSGIAEILKTALIGDRSILELLERMDIENPDKNSILKIILKCLEVKGGIVTEDLRETGKRMLLNLGHTIGHALESASEFRLSHGEAVGLGLLGEAAIAVNRGGNRDLPGEIRGMLKQAGLPTGVNDMVSGEKLSRLFKRDKKTRRNGRIWVLPFDWCDCRLTYLTPDQEEKALPFVMSLLRV
ncbi:MAG: 3-dehydroquinate synthase [Candidatus Aegiribacteria sp.]|nr:3-dehydroquinate synthase [Candidatus Aegiribacteria sp.]